VTDKSKVDERKARLAAALRQNLRRRKTQARAEASEASRADEPDER
jgi:hypothetical protein